MRGRLLGADKPILIAILIRQSSRSLLSYLLLPEYAIKNGVSEEAIFKQLTSGLLLLALRFCASAKTAKAMISPTSARK